MRDFFSGLLPHSVATQQRTTLMIALRGASLPRFTHDRGAAAWVQAGDAQDMFLHRLPLDEGPGAAPHRIALTMRSIVAGYEDRLGAASTSCVE